jgi:single-stranded-DNA-specific exonuclease
VTRLVQRRVPHRAQLQLEQDGLHPLLARIYAARGVGRRSELDYALNQLLPPAALAGTAEAAAMLADAIEAEARILVIGDYDCDGATATAVAVRGLRAFGARVEFLVPNRFTLGYGLSPEIVAIAAQRQPDLIVTVDNGIASVEGVAAARELGIATLITDHHLPGDALPEADCIVNPNQPGCSFPSKSLAGVGVMFYVLLALRAELRVRGRFGERPEPNLGNLLDLVALGTVADVVPLDRNNRILVAQGLRRIREGRLQPGVRALFKAAGRDPMRASSFELGFLVAPRLNAAGRLADMSLGIEALISDDAAHTLNIARELNQLNLERRQIEAGMQDEALARLGELDAEATAITVFQPDWHAGVVGILAARIKDRYHRPVFAFARADNDEVKGSGRSISGLHLRDALDLISKREPGLLRRFGGHAMAAGVTLAERDLARFEAAFAGVAAELVPATEFTRTLETDGSLESSYYSLEVARLLEAEVWGSGFPSPVFEDVFAVEQQRLLQDRHLKLRVRRNEMAIDAIRFHCADNVGPRVRLAFRLQVNEFNGVQSPQLLVEHIEAA